MRFLRENGLSLAFAVLFLICLVGQALAGAAQHPDTSLAGYLGSSEFLQGMFSNWQAALLQLLVLIVLTIFLRQKGASHSRKVNREPQTRMPTHEARLRWFGGNASWFYSNSLTLVFTALFVLAFVGFVLTDHAQVVEERLRDGQSAPALGAFLWSARFWFDLFQTWEAEFFAMAVFLVLTIFLRQEGSAESKPVGASNADTGDTNE